MIGKKLLTVMAFVMMTIPLSIAAIGAVRTIDDLSDLLSILATAGLMGLGAIGWHLLIYLSAERTRCPKDSDHAKR